MKKIFVTTQYGITIAATQKTVLEKLKRAVSFAVQHDIQSSRLVKRMRAILVYPRNGYDNELFRKSRIWVCEMKTIRESSTPYLASLLVHEGWHLAQFSRGVRNVHSRAERTAYKTQAKFLTAIGDKRGARWVGQQLRSRAWETKLPSGKNAVMSRAEHRDFVRRWTRNATMKHANKMYRHKHRVDFLPM